MIKYVRKDSNKLTPEEWDKFFKDFNDNIVNAELDKSTNRFKTLKTEANALKRPIIKDFDITGNEIIAVAMPQNTEAKIIEHNNGIEKLSVLNYLVNLHHIGNAYDRDITNDNEKFKIHMNSTFLPWHRLFLVEFEDLLGSPLPYWNWYKNPKIPTNLTVAVIKDKIKKGNTKIYKDLNRDAEDISTSSFKSDFKNVWKNLYKEETRKDFVKIGDLIEVEMHNNIHISVGGDSMNNLSYSPHDPIFWFHHNFVDKIWADYYYTLSDKEKTELTNYPANPLPFFSKKAVDVKDIKKDLMISFEGLFKKRELVE